MEKKLARPVCRSEVIVSTLPKKYGSYEKIAEHFLEDQERAATEGIHSKVLAHPDYAIGKVCGPENEVLVVHRKQHVADLERQLQEAKDQVATLHRFLQQKYGDEVPTFFNFVLHTQSD
ncbi:hypothetical protein Ahy_B03g064834 [Arachis hypogaea]|uniref:Uncharacterized protein n=1 Tax=Arachis hypogaea TaxID=3818 RepID=A0A445A0H5_ARAHY|nr:hypothetical protein Ahy_B03g064834 [Arachis hypogaea]